MCPPWGNGACFVSADRDNPIPTFPASLCPRGCWMIQLCQQDVRGHPCIMEELLPGQPLASRDRRGSHCCEHSPSCCHERRLRQPQCGCSGACKVQNKLQQPLISEILVRREELSQHGGPDIFEQLNHTSCGQFPDTISPQEKFWLFMLLWLGFLSFWSLTEQIQGVYCKNWSWLGSPSWPGSPGFGGLRTWGIDNNLEPSSARETMGLRSQWGWGWLTSNQTTNKVGPRNKVSSKREQWWWWWW